MNESDVRGKGISVNKYYKMKVINALLYIKNETIV